MSDRLRVLLVEDNPGDAYLIVDLLETDGPEAFEVECADRLSEAIKYIDKDRFDIILLDLGLPDSDGLETLRAMRRHAADLPIVLLTGNNDEQTGLAAVREGAQDYLIKGQINKNLLTRSINYAAARKQAENALKELNETLEERIVERTAQLSSSNKTLRSEIAEREWAEERYHTLFNTLIEGFCVIEVLFDADDLPVDYRFLEVNPAFEAQTGLHNAQGKLMRELSPEHEAHWFEIYGKVALTGQSVRFVNEAKAQNRWYDVSAYRVGGQDSRKIAILINDITDRKQAEEQLQVMNDELERRVERRTFELQETQKKYLHAEKLSAIGTLSASIAHEFNNPLQGILSILKGLKKRAILEEEDRELLVAAIREGDRIKDLIRSLQDFNRPSSGKQAFMDMHKSLDSILLLQKSDLNGRQVSIVRNYAGELPQILAVPDQIKQVILNLLTNAADACPRGGMITVSTWQEGNKVAVAIKDTGIGIKPEEMDQIFQPFYTTKPEVKGTGLGLSVSYGIITNHQGEIRVESQLGEGATFTFLLPIKGTENANELA